MPWSRTVIVNLLLSTHCRYSSFDQFKFIFNHADDYQLYIFLVANLPEKIAKLLTAGHIPSLQQFYMPSKTATADPPHGEDDQRVRGYAFVQKAHSIDAVLARGTAHALPSRPALVPPENTQSPTGAATAGQPTADPGASSSQPEQNLPPTTARAQWPYNRSSYNAKEVTDFSSADFTIVNDVEELNKSCAYVLCARDMVIGPGEDRVLPTEVLNPSKKTLMPNMNIECLPDKALRGTGTQMTILTTPDILADQGWLVHNFTHVHLCVPKGAILARAIVDAREPEYGVARLQQFKEYERGDWHAGSQKHNLPSVNKQVTVPSTEPLTADEIRRAKKMLAEVKRSEFGKDLIESDSLLLHRLLFVYDALDFSSMDVDENAQRRLRHLLLAHCDRACMGLKDLPLADLPPMPIDTVDDRPIRIKMRHTPFGARDFVSKEIEEMLDAGIIRRIDKSRYSFPIVIAKKIGGGLRLCIDYRMLNKATHVLNGPIPKLEDAVNKISGMKYLASCDLKSAYWQLPLTKEAQEKTTFVVEQGTFAFLRIPFGLSSAPAYYQATLQNVLDEIKHSTDEENRHNSMAANYLDDIIVGGRTYNSYLDGLRKFFNILRKYDLKYSAAKSEWGKREVRYLGYVITGDAWYPDPERITALTKRPPPQNLRELRGCIAALSFYNRFLPWVATKIEPLMEKLRGIEKEHRKKKRKPVPIHLDLAAINAWHKAIEILLRRCILWHCQPEEPFYVFVDASDTASGSVLMQYKTNKDGEKQLRPLAFQSKVFARAERNYTATERELLGVMHALDKFNYMIFGSEDITVFTDHKSIISLLSAKAPTRSRLERWRIELSGYKGLKFKHIEGRNHGAADMLSRPPDVVYEQLKDYIENATDLRDGKPGLPDWPLVCRLISIRPIDGAADRKKKAAPAERSKIPVSETNWTEQLAEVYLDIDQDRQELIALQKVDTDCQAIAELKNSDVYNAEDFDQIADSPLALFARKCTFTDGLLVAPSDTLDELLVPVAPAVLRHKIMDAAHAGAMGHLRGNRLLELIAVRATWPTLRADLKAYLENCEPCKRFFMGRTIRPVPGRFIASAPLEQITIDAFELQTERSKTKKWVLAAIDTFTRFCWAAILDDQTTRTQCRALMQTVLQVGTPKMLVADQHPAYRARDFGVWANNLGIIVNLSPGYSSNHCALVNRAHRTLREMVLKSTTEYPDWEELLPYVVKAYNDSPHPATGFAPSELLLGLKPYLKVDDILGMRIKPTAVDKEDVISQLHLKRKRAYEVIKEKNDESLLRARANFHSTRKSKKFTVEIGETVYRKDRSTAAKKGKGQIVRFFGPYTVTELDPDGVHAWIVKTALKDAQAEYVHIEDLAPSKVHLHVPIYPSCDMFVEKRMPIADKTRRKAVEFDSSYGRSNPNHPYNTRHKPKGSDA